MMLILDGLCSGNLKIQFQGNILPCNIDPSLPLTGLLHVFRCIQKTIQIFFSVWLGSISGFYRRSECLRVQNSQTGKNNLNI